jgi:hypothetical protein
MDVMTHALAEAHGKLFGGFNGGLSWAGMTESAKLLALTGFFDSLHPLQIFGFV